MRLNRKKEGEIDAYHVLFFSSQKRKSQFDLRLKSGGMGVQEGSEARSIGKGATAFFLPFNLSVGMPVYRYI